MMKLWKHQMLNGRIVWETHLGPRFSIKQGRKEEVGMSIYAPMGVMVELDSNKVVTNRGIYADA